ncbi:MAG: hypothetical protein M4579_004303 [Chaenotheca gracillima]|nr:MAG: hypothetical protein M4579_004303 [Chaenotheca gracillima]
MSTLSRGHFPALVRPFFSLTSPTICRLRPRPFQCLRLQPKPCRSFSICPSLRLASKKQAPRLPSTSQTAKGRSNAVLQTQSFADTLAIRSSPTLLYQAPPYRAFILGSYAFSFFCFSYAGWNFYQHYLFPPPGLATWVPIAFGVVCIFMTGFGTWLLLGPSRIIRSISAIPLRSPSAHSLTTPRGAPLNLEIELFPVLPGISPRRRIIIPPSSFNLSSRLYQPYADPEAALRYITPREAALAREAEIKYDREHIMTVPFRHLSQALFKVFVSLRRVWTREGFTRVFVQGRKGVWKLDAGGGWAMDEGRALDRLVKIRNI